MTYKAIVTLEFDLAAPLTYRREVAATNPGTAASRALKAAQKAYSGRRWRSCVVVLEKP